MTASGLGIDALKELNLFASRGVEDCLELGDAAEHLDVDEVVLTDRLQIHHPSHQWILRPSHDQQPSWLHQIGLGGARQERPWRTDVVDLLWIDNQDGHGDVNGAVDLLTRWVPRRKPRR